MKKFHRTFQGNSKLPLLQRKKLCRKERCFDTRLGFIMINEQILENIKYFKQL
jgi:hypothetical protein